MKITFLEEAASEFFAAVAYYDGQEPDSDNDSKMR